MENLYMLMAGLIVLIVLHQDQMLAMLKLQNKKVLIVLKGE
jgi:hypothetical protein